MWQAMLSWQIHGGGDWHNMCSVCAGMMGDKRQPELAAETAEKGHGVGRPAKVLL